jgi:hypothetical protein
MTDQKPKLRRNKTTRKSRKADLLEDITRDHAVSETTPAPAPAPPARIGRPPLAEEITRTDIGLRDEDLRVLKRIGLDWTDVTREKTAIKVTPIVRSVIAVVLPALQDLDEAPRDEDELRELLRQKLGV